jgi:hypothetical protein
VEHRGERGDVRRPPAANASADRSPCRHFRPDTKISASYSGIGGTISRGGRRAFFAPFIRASRPGSASIRTPSAEFHERFSPWAGKRDGRGEAPATTHIASPGCPGTEMILPHPR